VQKARTGAVDRLETGLLTFPSILRSGCRQLAQIGVDLLSGEESCWWSNSSPPVFKVAFVVQAPHEWQFSIPYHFGYGEGSGPVIDQETLHDVWETLEAQYQFAEGDGPAAVSQTLLIPVSEHDTEASAEQRRLEQPLIVVIETDIVVRDDGASEEEFQSFLSDLATDVVAFVKEFRVYEAVQRSTEAL
jgi:hypothetical protein